MSEYLLKWCFFEVMSSTQCETQWTCHSKAHYNRYSFIWVICFLFLTRCFTVGTVNYLENRHSKAHYNRYSFCNRYSLIWLDFYALFLVFGTGISPVFHSYDLTFIHCFLFFGRCFVVKTLTLLQKKTALGDRYSLTWV